MGMKLYRSGRSKPEWIFFLTIAVKKPIPITFAERRYDCDWQLNPGLETG